MTGFTYSGKSDGRNFVVEKRREAAPGEGRYDFPTGSGRAKCMCSMHAPAPAWGLVDEKAWLAEVHEWDRLLAVKP